MDLPPTFFSDQLRYINDLMLQNWYWYIVVVIALVGWIIKRDHAYARRDTLCITAAFAAFFVANLFWLYHLQSEHYHFSLANADYITDLAALGESAATHYPVCFLTSGDHWPRTLAVFVIGNGIPHLVVDIAVVLMLLRTSRPPHKINSASNTPD